MIDLDELERLEKAASGPPWGDVCEWNPGPTFVRVTKDDSALIVALRNSAPDLIRELREARAEIARLQLMFAPLTEGDVITRHEHLMEESRKFRDQLLRECPELLAAIESAHKADHAKIDELTEWQKKAAQQLLDAANLMRRMVENMKESDAEIERLRAPLDEEQNEDRNWWEPVLTNSEWVAKMRHEYPDCCANLDDNGVRERYSEGLKYQLLWDNLGDATEAYLPLADAYLNLKTKVARLRALVAEAWEAGFEFGYIDSESYTSPTEKLNARDRWLAEKGITK